MLLIIHNVFKLYFYRILVTSLKSIYLVPSRCHLYLSEACHYILVGTLWTHFGDVALNNTFMWPLASTGTA